MVDLAACDHNLAEATARTLGAAGRLERRPGLVLGATGFADPGVNAAVVTAPATDRRAALDGVAAFFGDLPHQVWVRDRLDPGLVDTALVRGLAVTDGPPLMVLPAIDAAPTPPATLAISVATEADRHDVTIASAIGNGMAPHLAGAFLPADVLAGAGDAAVVVGRVGTEAVTTALVLVTGDAAGVYAVSTIPHHRGKGFGAAITRAAIEEGRRRGATWSLLQTSPTGRPVYESLGYRAAGRYQLLGPPSRPG